MPFNKIDYNVAPSVDVQKAFEESEISKSPQLTQEDMDRYIQLCSAYSGVDIPFEIQLAAWDNHDEPPSGVELNRELVGDISVIDFMREYLELRNRKEKYGVVKGVTDPDAGRELKTLATVVYTRCALELAEAEAIMENARAELEADLDLPDDIRNEMEKNAKYPAPRMAFFPTTPGAKLGREGYVRLFPDFNDSPVGRFRGDGASYNAQECVNFIGKHFPDVVDEFLKALDLNDE